MSDNIANRPAVKAAAGASLANRFHVLLVGVVVSITAAGFYRIPAEFMFPAHWGSRGAADWLWPRELALLGAPLLALVLTAAIAAVHLVMARSRVEMIRHNVEPALSAVLALIAALQFGLVLIGVGSDFDLIRLSALLVAAAVLVLGIVTAEAERHTYAGVRLPWTIGSDRLWKVGHRAAGWSWIVGAVVLGGLAWLQPDIGTLIVALAAVLVLPLVLAAAVSAGRG